MRVMVTEVRGRKKRVRHKRRWLDRVMDDIREKGLSGEEGYDRASCAGDTCNRETSTAHKRRTN